MKFPSLPLPLVSAMLSSALIACAQPPTPAAEPGAFGRIMLVTVADWPSGADLAMEAARRAGVAVTRSSAISPRLFALTLDCISAADCQRAIDRLGADKAFAVEVQPDRRRGVPARPSPSSSM